MEYQTKISIVCIILMIVSVVSFGYLICLTCENEGNVKIGIVSYEDYMCPYCENLFSSNQSRLTHIVQKHPNSSLIFDPRIPSN
jgi:hypothetical protein